MARSTIPWDELFAWMVANAATPAAAAARFGVNPSSVRPAVKHEADKLGGGRLGGHPTYGKPLPPGTTAGDATPALDPATAAAVYVPLSQLRPWARNPKKHGEADAIAASIIRWGFATPLVARLADREIIAGHGRIAAVMSLQKRHARASAADREAWHPEAVRLAHAPDPELPVRYMDLNEDEAHALALAENEASRATGYDPAVLAAVLRDFRARGVSTAAIGWNPAVITRMVGDGPKSRGRLPAAERSPVRRVTIELYDEDAGLLRRAIDAAREDDDPTSPERERTNGRRLGRVCAAFLAARGA